MVAVAERFMHQFVELVKAGSIPVSHPNNYKKTDTVLYLQSKEQVMARHWNINIQYRADATEKEQIEQVMASAEKSLININKATAKSILQQIQYHYDKGE